MAKYSVSKSTSSESEVCELCGETSNSLKPMELEQTTLSACPNCRRQVNGTTVPTADENDEGRDDVDTESNTNDSTTMGQDSLWNGDTERWEKDGVEYTPNRLPYLVDNYSKRVRDARLSEGLSIEELTESLRSVIDVDPSDIKAVERKRAIGEGVGGDVITALEERLGITLTTEK